MNRNSVKEIPSFPLHSFNELLQFCRDTFADSPAFSYRIKKDEKRTVSFNEFYADVKRLSASFHRHGLSKKRIALIGANSYEWIVSYFAVVCISAVIVPVDKELSENELSSVFRRSNCAAVIYSEEYAEKTEVAAKNRLTLFPLGEIRGLMNTDCGDFHLADSLPPGTEASVVFTSGTTGRSKGVILSHENLVSDAVACTQVVEDYQKCLLILPAHHTFGLVAGILVPMLKNCEIFISAGIRRFTKDIAFFRPQVLVLVPVMAETIYKKIWAAAEAGGKSEKLKKGVRLSNFLLKFHIDLRQKMFREVLDSLGGELQGIVCGGAAANEEYSKGFSDFGIDFLGGYGITECSPVVSVNSKKAQRPLSVGRPLDCNQIRITEKDENGIGCVEIKGSNVFSGYLDSPEEEADSFNNGWFCTGDLGTVDKDGFLYLTGRKKNLIVLSNGKNVSPEEIEIALSRNRYVSEVVVYEKGGKITAEIFPDEAVCDGQPEKKINSAVNEYNKSVPAYKNIEKVVVRDCAFPKTTTMKIKRKYEKKEKGDNIHA